MPLSATQLAQIKADLAAAQSEVNSLVAQAFDIPLNPAAVKAWAAKTSYGLGIIQNDVAALVADPTPVVVLALSTVPAESETENVAITPIALAASGGTAPYAFSITGAPAGVSLSSSGVISGTPSASGSFTVTVGVKDSGSPQQSKSETFTMTVAAPTPTPSGAKPGWGWWINADGQTPVTPEYGVDYCDNSDTTYTFTSQRTKFMSGKTPAIKTAFLSTPQSQQLAQVLITAGHPDAIVVPAWEGDQGVAGWMASWNELALSAASYKAKFKQQHDDMMAVPGAKFTFAWCPNVNQQNEQAPGRTQTDTWPGIPGVVVAPDAYDANGDTGSQVASVLAQTVVFETFAQSVGAQFFGLLECGDYNSDDPTYWTDLLQHAEANGWKCVAAFSGTAQDAAFNSLIGANSTAAIKAFYAS